jgi:hypothetical protein
MGQTIQILKTATVDNVTMFDTDRSITGQDGHNYGSALEAQSNETFPSQLAARWFEADSSIENVYLFSNAISVARVGGWDDVSRTVAEFIIRNFFVVYEDNQG